MGFIEKFKNSTLDIKYFASGCMLFVIVGLVSSAHLLAGGVPILTASDAISWLWLMSASILTVMCLGFMSMFMEIEKIKKMIQEKT